MTMQQCNNELTGKERVVLVDDIKIHSAVLRANMTCLCWVTKLMGRGGEGRGGEGRGGEGRGGKGRGDEQTR